MINEIKDAMAYLTRDCGLSAQAIIYRMNGIDVRRDHPHDPSDFSRCMKLFELFPMYKTNLHLMSDVSPEWALLVEHWQALESLFVLEDNGEQLYNRMKDLFNNIPCTSCGQPLNGIYTSIQVNAIILSVNRIGLNNSTGQR